MTRHCNQLSPGLNFVESVEISEDFAKEKEIKF